MKISREVSGLVSQAIGRLTSAKDRARHVGSLLHFENEEICRGSRLTYILHTGGSIFADSGGSAATYELSEQVDTIDAFISHNWSVPRWKKFTILSMYFNYVPAVVLSLMVMLTLFILTVTDVLPQFEFNGAESDDGLARRGFRPRRNHHPGPWAPGHTPAPPQHPLNQPRRLQEEDEKDFSGIWCQAISAPVFIFVLFTWHEIRQRLCFRQQEPYVFLDKTCIHQTDAELKKDGIMHLGAFLDKSYKMIIIYTDVYLHKLWTVYEVASFLCLHPVRDMVLYPVQFAFAVLCSIGLCYVCILSQWILVLFGPKWELFGYSTMCLVAHILLRPWSYIQAQVHRQVHDFDVHDTMCFCEDDRALVYANIAGFMAHFDVVNKYASQETALSAFNSLVRQALPGAISESLGTIGLRYGWVTIALVLTLLPKEIDRLAARLLKFDDLTSWDIFIEVSHSVSLVWCVCPLYIAAGAIVSRKCLNNGKLCDCMMVAIGFLSTNCMAFGLIWAIKDLKNLAFDNPEDGTSLIPIIALQLFLAICTVFTYSSRAQNFIRTLISRKAEPDADLPATTFLGVAFSAVSASSDNIPWGPASTVTSTISKHPDIQIVGKRKGLERE